MELEKHLTENIIDDVHEFVNEREHETVKKYHKVIERHDSTLDDVTSEIEDARKSSARIREEHSKAEKDLTFADAEVSAYEQQNQVLYL